MVVWKRLPMVATSKPGTKRARSVVAVVTSTSATSGAGTRCSTLGTSRSSASVAAATPASVSEAVPRASHSASTFSW